MGQGSATQVASARCPGTTLAPQLPVTGEPFTGVATTSTAWAPRASPRNGTSEPHPDGRTRSGADPGAVSVSSRSALQSKPSAEDASAGSTSRAPLSVNALQLAVTVTPACASAVQVEPRMAAASPAL